MLRISHDGVAHGIEVEVKSTTNDTVSTARDVGMEHIRKWRRKLFVIGYYSREARRPELQRCLCLTPADMKPWIDALEEKISVDFCIAQRVAGSIELVDLWDVCGQQVAYPAADARRVLKQQWTTQQYLDAADGVADGQPSYSPGVMLQVLRLRAGYIAQRGATLNNPHITKNHLSGFLGTDSAIQGDWAARIRRIAADWLAAH